MQSMLQVFKSNLEDFALKHKKDIKRDPTFRMHFQQMCHNVGVDPLASNKGFWAEMLGVGDFYYELGVQIAQVCIATREKNGGYIEMEKLKKELKVIRGSKAQAISEYVIANAFLPRCVPLRHCMRVEMISFEVLKA